MKTINDGAEEISRQIDKALEEIGIRRTSFRIPIDIDLQVILKTIARVMAEREFELEERIESLEKVVEEH